MYHAGELVISTQVFGGGHLGVMSSTQMLVSPEKVTKVKRYFICCDIIFYLLRKDILSIAIRYFICGDIILNIKKYFICCDIILKVNRYFIC